MSQFRKMASDIARHAIKLHNTKVVLYGPDGIIYDKDINGDPLVCEFLSGRTTVIPDSGEECVVFRPVAVFHRSLLIKIPQYGENWAMAAPLNPDFPASLTMLSMDQSKAIEGGRSLGIIRIYFSEVNQI